MSTIDKERKAMCLTARPRPMKPIYRVGENIIGAPQNAKNFWHYQIVLFSIALFIFFALVLISVNFFISLLLFIATTIEIARVVALYLF